jgi:hypothetical protein
MKEAADFLADPTKGDLPYQSPTAWPLLSQIKHKLRVEARCKAGIEKMALLYRNERDWEGASNAEKQKVKSDQRTQLLKQALKKYEGLHIVDNLANVADNEASNNTVRQGSLSGHMKVHVHAVDDVNHATTRQCGRGPKIFVTTKVEGVLKGRTKATRTNRWLDETHEFDVYAAKEIEFTVYHLSRDRAVPIALLWYRIADIVNQTRHKRAETEFGRSGRMTSKRVVDDFTTVALQSQTFPNSQTGLEASASEGPSEPGLTPESDVFFIDGCFSLEPVGRIYLSLSFTKQAPDRNPLDVSLCRSGAVREKKLDVVERCGHKLSLRMFYDIMRCACCTGFLSFSPGMRCSDCKYVCHEDCYHKIYTKCISKSNVDPDADEGKLNHRIPHRLLPFGNMGVSWCCHCGYMLPFGKEQSRRCTECKLTCHADCVRFVPDLCGMSMKSANRILTELKRIEGPTLYNSLEPPRPVSANSLNSERPIPPSSRPLQMRSPGPDPRSRDRVSQRGTAMRQDSFFSEGSPSRQKERKQPVPQQQPLVYGSAKYSTVEEFPLFSQQQPVQRQPLAVVLAQSSCEETSPASAVQAPSLTPPTPQKHVQRKLPPTVSAPVVEQCESGSRAPAVRNGAPISPSHFDFLTVIGRGSFGKVMLAEARSSKNLCAIKILKKHSIVDEDAVQSMRSEKSVFLIANEESHPFLLNLHACFQSESRIFFVMEYVAGGDLMSHILRGEFGIERAQFYATEVCLALKYLHSKGVVYRDLKLDNIMLTLDGHIKLADYGLCKGNMWEGCTTSTFCGTPDFMAPEILLDKAYGRSVDWWAFGVLMYQMLLHRSPFPGQDENDIYDAILVDEPLYPIDMTGDSVSLIQQLLTRDPELRLGSGPTDAQEVMNHKFFRDVSWDDVYHKRTSVPFVPRVKGDADTSNFESEFTRVAPVLTPACSGTLSLCRLLFVG